MEVDARFLAQPVALAIGQQAEAWSHPFLPEMKIARSATIGVPNRSVPSPGDAEDVLTSLGIVGAEGRRAEPGLGVRRECLPRNLALGYATLGRDLLDQRGRERLADRCAPGVGGDDLDRERFAVEVDVAGGAQADLEAPDRQPDRRHLGQVILRQPGGEAKRLLLGEPLGRELDVILAGGVGLPAQGAAVGEADLDRPRCQRCTVLIARDHVRLDRLAAVDHALLDVEDQIDRLEVVGLHLEAARENALARLRDRDAIGAQRRGGIERQRLVERAEVRQGHGPGDDQPAATVGDLEPVDRPGHVGILALLDLAYHAADRDLLTRPIGWPVGVDVRARAQALGDLVRYRQMRARDIRTVEDQVAQVVIQVARGIPVPDQDAVRAGGRLEHDLAAIGDEDPRAGAAATGLHVLGEDEDLLARRLDDGVDVAADHQRGGLERLLVGDLHHEDARKLQLLQVIRCLDRLVPGITGHRGGP